jgi:hypothetical protein
MIVRSGMAESSCPFELKGGSPLVLHVTLDGEKFELRIMPVVIEVQHAPERKNEENPEVPVFLIKANLNVVTKKVVE